MARKHDPARRACLQALVHTPLLAAVAPAMAQVTGASVADETWIDGARKREVPVRLRWPDGGKYTGPRPVLLFSHGLGGTREGGAVWGEAWADAGFVVVHLQHAGSDLPALRAVASSFADKAGLRSAAGPEQLLARLRDVGFALDEIGRRHAAGQGRWWWCSAMRNTDCRAIR